MSLDVASILDLGVPGLLLIAVIIVWREYKTCSKENVALRVQLYEDAKENAVIAKALIAVKQKEVDGG